MPRPDEAAPALIYKDGDTVYVDGEEMQVPEAVKSVTYTLSNAEIKALPTTGVELKPAPGVGSRYQIVGGAAIADFTAGGYTNADATLGNGLYIAAGSAISGIVPLNNFFETNLMTFTDEPFTFDILPRMLANEVGDGVNPNIGMVSYFDNQPLTVKYDNNSAGNFTGGNAANTMKLIVLFRTI